MLYVIVSIFSIITGFIGTIVYITHFTKYLADPFTLDIFISNSPKPDDISFRITNNTDYSLNTEIKITPIVFQGEYSTQKFEIVLNPKETLEKPLKEGDYNNIRNINKIHGLNGASYEYYNKPVMFRVRATYKNSRFKVIKIPNYVENIRAYNPRGKIFERVK